VNPPATRLRNPLRSAEKALDEAGTITTVGRFFRCLEMPDEVRSPIKHHLVLHRIDLVQGIRRFYSLIIERDLFGTVRVVRNWGRVGTNGQELAEIHEDEISARQALEALAQAKRRRGYQDL
jgi:predicted DNA-binding WGR domain protein